jgi:hypothetical protein
VRVDLHDVPEDWPLADQNHGLGPEFGLFPETSSLAATKDDDFQLGYPKMEQVPALPGKVGCKVLRASAVSISNAQMNCSEAMILTHEKLPPQAVMRAKDASDHHFGTKCAGLCFFWQHMTIVVPCTIGGWQGRYA